MKTSLKLTLATLAATFALHAQAHPGHDHHAADANVVHSIEGVTTTDQDKVANTEKTTEADVAQRTQSEKETKASKAQK